MKMKTIIGAVASLAIVGSVQAQTQTKELAKSGQWTAWSARIEPNNQFMCSVGTKGKDWFFWFKWIDGVNWFQIQKQGWRIPLGTTVPLSLQFDEHEPHSGTAGSRPTTNNLSGSLTDDKFQTVMKEFIASKTMHIKFPNGSDRGWSVSLDGADKIARTYMKCVTDYEKNNRSPQPHQDGQEPKKS
jgi:hypothetical protein